MRIEFDEDERSPCGTTASVPTVPWGSAGGSSKGTEWVRYGTAFLSRHCQILIHCSCCCPLFIENELELCTWELIGVCMLVNRTSWRCSSFVSMSVSGWPSVEEEVLIIRVAFVCLITGRG